MVWRIGLSLLFRLNFTHFSECGKSATDIQANFSLQKKNKIKKPGMVGTNSVKMKFLMPKEAPIKGTADYTGFVSWWRKLCGQDFLDGYFSIIIIIIIIIILNLTNYV